MVTLLSLYDIDLDQAPLPIGRRRRGLTNGMKCPWTPLVGHWPVTLCWTLIGPNWPVAVAYWPGLTSGRRWLVRTDQCPARRGGSWPVSGMWLADFLTSCVSWRQFLLTRQFVQNVYKSKKLDNDWKILKVHFHNEIYSKVYVLPGYI